MSSPHRGPREKLSEKQHRFINAYLDKAHAQDAAIAAGYDRSAGARLLAHPTIAAEIKRRREEVAEEVDFNLGKAMRQLEVGIELARAKGQMMAYMKGAELMGKLMGLYIEKMDVRQLTNFRINILGMPPTEAASLVNTQALGDAAPLPLNPAREIMTLDDAQFEVATPTVDEDIFGL